MPLTPQRLLAVAAPALYYIMLSSMALTFQLWGGPQDLGRYAIVGYLCGLFGSGLLLAGRGRMGTRPASGSLRRVGPPLLLALVIFPVWGFASGAVASSLPVFFVVGLCVGALLAPATWLFFVHAPGRSRGLLYGSALACAQVCWALLSPLVNGPAEGPLLQDVAGRYLALLTIVNALSGLGLAYALWRLSALPLPEGWTRAEKNTPACKTCPLWPFLLPILLCFFLNGLLNFQFSARFQSRLAVLPEYAHIILALGLPLLGALMDSRGDRLLARALAACACLLALGPLVLALPEHSHLSLAVRMCGAMAVQALYFAGSLACARFAPQRRWPALVASAAWLGIGGAILGGLAARFALPALPLPAQAWAWIAAGLCLASILPLLRAAMPALPAESGLPGPEPDRLAVFAAAFGLSERETQVLDGIRRDISAERIALELGISESTVRFHQTGLFKKTGQVSRRRLARFFRVWSPQSPDGL